MKHQLDAKRNQIEQALIHFFDQLPKDPATLFDPLPGGPLFEQVRQLTMRGGKRIRGTLVISGAELFGSGWSDENIRTGAVAMELFQTYLLIHDDIMDDDVERRGGPSVHTALEKWQNNKTMGRSLGILAGDLAAALAERARARLIGKRAAQAIDLFARMHQTVVFGQQFDLLAERCATDVALWKTASYTTIGPLCIGAALGGATKDQIKSVEAMAKPVGLAFQLRDDIIGVFGKPGDLGKPVGSDIRNNKNSGLLAEARATGDYAVNRALDDACGKPLDHPAIARAVKAVEESGARARCEDRIDRYTRTAHQRLVDGPFSSTAIAFLGWLFDQLAGRST